MVWYVDDIFADFNKKEDLEQLCNRINGFSTTVKFTTEIEEENNLPFLNVNVLKQINSLPFSVHRQIHTYRRTYN